MKNFYESFTKSNDDQKDALPKASFDIQAPESEWQSMAGSDSVYDSVVRSPDIYNPQQYGSGIPPSARVLAPTSQSQNGLADFRLAPEKIEEALNSKPFDASLESEIIAGKYRTSRIGGDGRVQYQASVTPVSDLGLTEFQTVVTDTSRKQSRDEDWKRVQAIVRAQQSEPTPTVFRENSRRSVDLKLESDLVAKQRTVSREYGDPAGLNRYQPAPLHERMGDIGFYSKQERVLRRQGLDIIYGLRNKIGKYWKNEQIRIGLDLDIVQLTQEIAVEKDEKKRQVQERVLANFRKQRAEIVAKTEDTFRFEEQLAIAEQVWQKKFGRIPDEVSISK